jgi:hypothetical protein
MHDASKSNGKTSRRIREAELKKVPTKHDFFVA